MLQPSHPPTKGNSAHQNDGNNPAQNLAPEETDLNGKEKNILDTQPKDLNATSVIAGLAALTDLTLPKSTTLTLRQQLTQITEAAPYLEKPVADKITKIAVKERVDPDKLQLLLQSTDDQTVALFSTRALARLDVPVIGALQLGQLAEYRNCPAKVVSDEVLLIYWSHEKDRIVHRWDITEDVRKNFKKLPNEEKQYYIDIHAELETNWREFCSERGHQGISLHQIARLYVLARDTQYIREVLYGIQATNDICESNYKSDSEKFSYILKMTQKYVKDRRDITEIDISDKLEKYARAYDQRRSENW